VPANVHRLANNIVTRIHERQEKVWRPRDFDGEVKTYYRFEDVPVVEGQWLLMASTNYMLNPVHEWLKSLGMLFERNGIPSLSANIAHAVADWEKLRKGLTIYGEAVKNVYKYLDTSAVARGFKTFKTGEATQSYSLETLQKHFGLQTDVVWHAALTRIPDDKREYLIALLRRGTKLSESPRIRLSTIHGAKGGEADNVMLMMDLSPKFALEYAANADNIHRLFYVGVTRAKKTLHLILPKHQEKGFRL
jgi:hypothetical protein